MSDGDDSVTFMTLFCEKLRSDATQASRLRAVALSRSVFVEKGGHHV